MNFLSRYAHLVNGALALLFVIGLFILGKSLKAEAEEAPVSVSTVEQEDSNEGWPYPTEEEVKFVHPPQKKEEVVEIVVDTVVTDVENDTDEVKVEAFGAELVSETEKVEHKEETSDTSEVDTVEVKVDTVSVKTDTTATDTTKNQ